MERSTNTPPNTGSEAQGLSQEHMRRVDRRTGIYCSGCVVLHRTTLCMEKKAFCNKFRSRVTAIES